MYGIPALPGMQESDKSPLPAVSSGFLYPFWGKKDFPFPAEIKERYRTRSRELVLDTEDLLL